jgi:hypothetical protein
MGPFNFFKLATQRQILWLLFLLFLSTLMDPAPRICSKAKCKAVLPAEILGQQFFKTCEKCRNSDAARRKRKREEKEHAARAPPPPPLPNQDIPMDIDPEDNQASQSDILPDSDEDGKVSMTSVVSVNNTHQFDRETSWSSEVPRICSRLSDMCSSLGQMSSLMVPLRLPETH